MHVSEEFAKVARRSILAFGLILLGFVVSDTISPQQSAQAQNAGTVGIQAQMQPIFVAQTATKCSSIVNDIGQGSNILFVAQTNSGGGQALIDFEWSPTGAAPFYTIQQASYVDYAAATHILTTNGYFPNLRSCLTYTSGTYSAWYSASSGPASFVVPALGTYGPTSPVTCDQTSNLYNLTTATTGFLGPFPINTANDTVVICSITVSFNGATSTGDINFTWAGNNSCASPVEAFFDYTTSGTPQTYVIPTQMHSFFGVGSVRNFLCAANASGATVSMVINWASIKTP